MVAIGASAGGLEAFRQLLGELPPDSGMAFILVQHLAPQHESHLAELLSKTTPIPVLEATHGLAVRPNHVYVIPPNSNLAIGQGVLHVTPRGDARGPHLPIDYLFRSLAEEQQGRAIGVVLSGSGSDGTVGLCEIKAVGGITFAQDTTSAAHAGMPSSAKDSGCVDFVLRSEEIAHQLLKIATHPYLAPAPAVEEGKGPDAHFRRIIAIVRRVMAVDFSLYRGTTIRRRIMRRMALHGQNSLEDYAKRLEKDRDEVEALYHDLLINVTSFFRDPEMFEALKEVVFPALTKDRAPSEPFRIWVAGCSTGQEAYSLAIALLEFQDSLPSRFPIQVFATDLSDQTALEKARAGAFPESIEAEVSPARLRRFFRKEDHMFRIDKSIRDMCVFARHNVTADPPFSHLDLISCRNVLIYLSTPLQKRVIPTFHYALDVPGFLVLGAAESIGEHGDLFHLVDRAHKVYSKRNVPARPLPFSAGEAGTPIGVGRRHAAPIPVDFLKEADRILLGRFAPPAVLVDQRLEIVHFRGRTSPYLEAPAGEPTLNVLKMARNGLFLELRGALAEADKTLNPVRRERIRITSDEGSREIALEVLPVGPGDDGAGCFLVLFHELGKPDGKPRSPVAGEPQAESSRRKQAGSNAKREVENLRQELASTKEYLQSLAEQQDAANEELRSANEEILSSNEELQSTNEELETAKEELQSANEELTTVNEQLQHRNTELSEINNDLNNLIASTNIPLIMVGSDLRIRRFTASAKRLMHLVPTDVERPIGDIRVGSDDLDLEQIINSVTESVQVFEREVRDREGRWYTLRISPYRTSDNRIEGAVLVLADIDEMRRTREELREQAAQLLEQSALIELSHDAIIVRDEDGQIVTWNDGAEEIYGYSAEEALGQKLDVLLRHDPGTWATLNTTLQETGFWEGDLHQWRRDGTEIYVQSHELLIKGEHGRAARVLSIKRDITESRRMLRALKYADVQKDEFLATLAHELRNPIAPIRNAVEIMRLAGDDPSTLELVRGMLDRQVGQLSRIIDDLLDVSRIVERKVELRLEHVPLADMVNTAVESSLSLIESCGHQLSVAMPAEPIYLDVDRVRISQVIVNLLNNAAKFSEKGGRIWLDVENASDPTRPQVVIRVRDTGIGVSKSMQGRIFEMFEQGAVLPEHGKTGLGVGLTLVRSLVQMHGGSVEVASEGPGQGSEFTVRLPSAAPRVAPPPVQAVPEVAIRSRKILVVDDNHDQAESLGKLLGLMGHEIRVAYDGEAALRVTDKFLPDVALVDIGLPKLSGYEVAATLRGDPRFQSTILVAQTGWGQDSDRQRSRSAGFDHHIVKPADIRALREILAKS